MAFIRQHPTLLPSLFLCTGLPFCAFHAFYLSCVPPPPPSDSPFLPPTVVSCMPHSQAQHFEPQHPTSQNLFPEIYHSRQLPLQLKLTLNNFPNPLNRLLQYVINCLQNMFLSVCQILFMLCRPVASCYIT